MDSPLQELCYADLYKEGENVLINSPPSTSLEPKELRLVGPGDDDALGHSSNELLSFNGSQMNVYSADSSFDLNHIQQNSVHVDPRTSSSPDESSLIFECPSKNTTPELEESRSIANESPLPQYLVIQFDNLWYLVPMQQYPSAALPEKSIDELQNVELPMQQPSTVEVPKAPVVEQQMVENLEEPLHEVAQRVAVATEEKEYPPPALSYPYLSALALKNSPDGKLTVAQIYSFIGRHFPYYKTAPSGWKNSLRHGLTYSQSFKKIETMTNGCVRERRSLWAIEDAKATKLYENLRKKTRDNRKDICRAMCNPESLDQLVNGEMKSSSGLDDEEKGFMSEFMTFKMGKRQVTEEDESLCVYPPAKLRKIDDFLMINATAVV